MSPRGAGYGNYLIPASKEKRCACLCKQVQCPASLKPLLLTYRLSSAQQLLSFLFHHHLTNKFTNSSTICLIQQTSKRLSHGRLTGLRQPSRSRELSTASRRERLSLLMAHPPKSVSQRTMIRPALWIRLSELQ